MFLQNNEYEGNWEREIKEGRALTYESTILMD